MICRVLISSGRLDCTNLLVLGGEMDRDWLIPKDIGWGHGVFGGCHGLHLGRDGVETVDCHHVY